jgi:hypothetical protein
VSDRSEPTDSPHADALLCAIAALRDDVRSLFAEPIAQAAAAGRAEGVEAVAPVTMRVAPAPVAASATVLSVVGHVAAPVPESPPPSPVAPDREPAPPRIARPPRKEVAPNPAPAPAPAPTLATTPKADAADSSAPGRSSDSRERLDALARMLDRRMKQGHPGASSDPALRPADSDDARPASP